MGRKRRGQSFRDPVYDEIEARLERKYGLPSGGIKAIRTKGERSNADQVSPVGARTVYQIMPRTRELFRKKYGVDAYASIEGAAEIAALHLKESMDRNNGSWEIAVREYHGGPDRRRWGPVNDAYIKRVMGRDGQVIVPQGPAGRAAAPARVDQPIVDIGDYSADQILNSTPDQLFERNPSTPAQKEPTVKEIVRDKIVGADGIKIDAIDNTAVNAEEVRQVSKETLEAELDGYTHWDRFKASFSDTLTGNLADMIGREDPEYDEDFQKSYMQNWQEIESFGESDEEVEQLREAVSQADLENIQERIKEQRERTKVLSSADNPTLLALGTGVLDPVGWAAGLGVGKGFQLAGLGSRSLAAGGRPIAAAAAAGAEGVVGNVAVTAGLDATGEHITPGEYGVNAVAGLLIGASLGAIANRGAADEVAYRDAQQLHKAQREQYEAAVSEVQTELGPNASPEEVTEAVKQRVIRDHRDLLEYALADIPEDQRIMVSEDILTADENFAKQIAEANDLESVSDITERAMIAETIARAERLVDNGQIDEKALNTILAKVGQESTAGRLLLSESPVARAVGLSLLENAQGAGGRRRSAAITMATRERTYVETFSGYDAISRIYQKNHSGVSRVRNALDGSSNNQFNREVMLEVERRGKPNYSPHQNPMVRQAADLFEDGMDMMRLEQQHVGTVGAARLGDSSVGYVPHRLDPRKLLELDSTQQAKVRSILAAQFRDVEGWDADFSDKLASKYLERGIDAAAGRYHVPFNLHSPEAGEMVRDALEALNIGPEEMGKLMGKFSRGGAGHTKKRLRLDLEEEIGDGRQLVDLFVTDMPLLYRSYARRTAGEVALAQYGVMGKKGLTILSKAITATGGKPKDIEAFDQIASEFLNTPYGTNQHAWMDNVRIATSASRLGGMGFTQFAEFGNAIPSLGVQAAFRGVKAMPRLMNEVRGLAKGVGEPNPMLKDIDLMNGTLGLDDYHTSRMFDVRDNEIALYNQETMGVFSRAVRGGAHANMVMSGHRMVMATQIRGMAEQIINKAVKYAKSGADDTALRDMGFSDEILAAMRKNMDNIAEFDGKGELVKLNLLNSKLKPQQIAEISQAVERGASQIIQRTYVGETGKWAHDGFLKLLTQFRTFSVTSVEKQWGRNLKNYGALKSSMYLLGAMSFAAPIHMARVQSKMVAMDDAKAKQYAEDNLNAIALTRATLNYASSGGLLGDIMDVGAGVFSNYGGDFGERFGDAYSPRGGRADQLIGGVIAPGAGLVQDVYQGVMEGNPEKLVRSLPGSNLPYVSPFVRAGFDAIEDE